MAEELKHVTSDDAKAFLLQNEEELKTSQNPSGVPKILHPDPENPDYKSLGRINVGKNVDYSSMPDVGWKTIPVENLPSQGKFYPDDVKITMRSASNKEVRHYSTIDEDDFLDVDDKLNFIVENCIKISSNSFQTRMSSKDLLEIDRFYLLLCVRDYTFPDNENKLKMNITCNRCGHNDQLEITRDRLNYFTLDPFLLERYDKAIGGFKIETKEGQKWNLFMPTIGTSTALKNIRRNRQNNNQSIDPFFFTYALLIFSDWRKINDVTYKDKEQDSHGWSNKKISVMNALAEKFKSSVDLNIKNQCTACGTEVASPFYFQGGWKALFLYDTESALADLV